MSPLIIQRVKTRTINYLPSANAPLLESRAGKGGMALVAGKRGRDTKLVSSSSPPLAASSQESSVGRKEPWGDY